jgi:hypothetical protein
MLKATKRPAWVISPVEAWMSSTASGIRVSVEHGQDCSDNHCGNPSRKEQVARATNQSERGQIKPSPRGQLKLT